MPSGYTPIEVSWPSVSTAGTLTASTVGDRSTLPLGLRPRSGRKRQPDVDHLAPEGLAAEPYSVILTFLTDEVDPGLDPTSSLGAAFDGVTWTLPPVSARSASSISLDVPAMGAVSFGAAMPAANLAVTIAGPTSVIVDVVSTYQVIVSQRRTVRGTIGDAHDRPSTRLQRSTAVSTPGGACSVGGQTIACDLGLAGVGRRGDNQHADLVQPSRSSCPEHGRLGRLGCLGPVRRTTPRSCASRRLSPSRAKTRRRTSPTPPRRLAGSRP